MTDRAKEIAERWDQYEKRLDRAQHHLPERRARMEEDLLCSMGSAAPEDIRWLLGRVRELEAELSTLRVGKLSLAMELCDQKTHVKRLRYLLSQMKEFSGRYCP